MNAGRSSRRVAWKLGLAVLVGAFLSPVNLSAEGDKLPAGPGNQVQGQAGGQQAGAKVSSDICDILKQRGLTRERSDYEEWIKNLICDYLEADFRDPTVRTVFVRGVLNQLQQHARGARWELSPDNSVAYIVAHKPYYCYLSDKGERILVLEAMARRTGAVRRSRFRASYAVIGIHDDFFHTPKPSNKDEALKVIPKAETAILAIVGLKKWADLVMAHPKGLDGKQVVSAVTEAVTNFQKTMLKQASSPGTYPGGTIDPKPPAPPDVQLSDLANLNEKNIFYHDPSTGDPVITIDQVTRGTPLGMTVSRFGVLPNLDTLKLAESIEDKEKYDEGKLRAATLVKMRTLFVIDVFRGFMQGEKIEQNKETIIKVKKVIRVILPNDKTDICMTNIKTHEGRHVYDDWEAWRDSVILPFKSLLEQQTFPEMEEKVVWICLEQWPPPEKSSPTQESPKTSYFFLDIAGGYFFPNDKMASAAKDSLAKLLKEKDEKTKKNIQQRFINSYIQESERRENDYHEKEFAGLDDNCNPVKGCELSQRRKVIFLNNDKKRIEEKIKGGPTMNLDGH